MTLKKFRELTKDLDENLPLVSLYGEFGRNYDFIETLRVKNHLYDDTQEFEVCEELDYNLNNIEQDYDAKKENIQITKVILIW